MTTSITGAQRRGRGDGTRLGFPTINIAYENIQPDEYGVWFSYVQVGDTMIPSVTHIGPCTLYDQQMPTREVHILDWDDTYRQGVYTITLLQKHRDTVAVDSEASLIALMKQDKAAARAYFLDIK